MVVATSCDACESAPDHSIIWLRHAFPFALIEANKLLGDEKERAYKTGTAERGSHYQLEDEINRVKRELITLRMITEAMWTLLEKRSNLTNQQLSQSLAELCLRDSAPKQTSKAEAGRVVVCEKCKRSCKRGTVKCAYCGHATMPEYVFSLLVRW
jgi:predicted RNA binding protein YcfA (HicA-like mRNA interferase family)